MAEHSCGDRCCTVGHRQGTTPSAFFSFFIYCKANKTKLNDLDILYKKVAKIALGVDKTESSMTVYKEMKWLPLHLRRQVHLSSYVLKIIKGKSPSNFINKFKKNY